MPEFYRRTRGHPFVDYLTAPQAAKVFEDAEADPHGDVEGSLWDPDGFAFWGAWHETTGGMVRVRVTPVEPADVPDAVRRHLQRLSRSVTDA